MRKYIVCIIASLITYSQNFAQIDAGLFRYPDVSATQIAFTYANDIWILPKEGGTAIRLSSPAGVESFPKFSPDGKTIAFSGNYDGNTDVYTIPASGGIPFRLTQHGYPDRVVEWNPDGKRVLFASGRESGRERYNQFFTIPSAGGTAVKLPLAYAEFGSYSPDGKEMAVTFISQVFRNWKRYRGGWNADIHVFNFASNKSEKITTSDASDELPMWHKNSIYFLSDRGPELRMNLWRYDMAGKTYTQLTNFKDYDAHFPSLGPDDIVFEAAGKLYLYGLTSQQLKEVKVSLVNDRAGLKPVVQPAEKYIQHAFISPDGNRALIEARGQIFSVPAENGYVKDLTRTPAAAERYPAWSPDGKTVAYWSDESGEYELWMMEPGKENSARKLTSYGAGFRYNLFWSPDNKKLAFIDKAMKIKVYDLATDKTTDIDRGMRMSHGPLEGFRCSWSPDSRWLTYARDLENYHSAVFLYDYQDKKLHKATSGFYDCYDPVFDPDGKYLYLFTNQSFQPNYSDLDNTFIYANTTQLAAISLTKTTPSLLYAKNDEVGIKRDEEKQKADSVKKVLKDAGVIAAKKPAVAEIDIDLNGIERRLVILPLKPGNYANTTAVKGKIVYHVFPNTGAGEGKASVRFFDLDKREEKIILDDVNRYYLSANGNKILVRRQNTWAIIKPEENQKFEKPLRIAEMQTTINPEQEWKQVFMDTWRLERDYFYDPGMHGVNWELVKDRYLKMLNGALTREEVNVVLGEMIGELDASHTYKGGGDEEIGKVAAVGYLGIDWQSEGNLYKIKKIIQGASWDAESRSPLETSGSDIKEGDYILAVNGIPITTSQEPFAAFVGLAGKTIELTYNSSASFTGAKTAIIKTMDDESRLRHLAWIEENRKRVDEATNGEAGYIYVRSTGIDGQNELIRQFNAQWDKKALVIDERFNNGGQIPDRFIELLNRTPLAFWAIRDGNTWPWPPFAHFGPKVMLINGWSGSGGDAFPDYFRKKQLGPLIGTRTWGGLIGISGVPTLIDGGGITVPTFRMYNPDGTWFKEGHGVEPDILVDEDLASMAKGVDPQLERAIIEIKALIKTKGFTRPGTPPYEKRSGF
ncbi:MAG: PD40 domain-containing protein [Chitinophagaceae bacterium]|nr:PD40 domain-containing protein [Chitinophagaceae bacterium]